MKVGVPLYTIPNLRGDQGGGEEEDVDAINSRLARLAVELLLKSPRGLEMQKKYPESTFDLSSAAV